MMVMTLNAPAESASGSLLVGFPGYASYIGYIADAYLDYDGYQRLLDHLLTLHTSSGWWLGDLLIQFEGAYGSKYAAALPDRRENPARYQACASAKWVCGKFEFYRRRQNLTFSHHRELAGIDDVKEQDLWLERASEGGWSVKQLRRELKGAQRPDPDIEAPELLDTTESFLSLSHHGTGGDTGSDLPTNGTAAGLVDGFLAGTGKDGESNGKTEEAPRLPTGTMVIPADPDLLATVLGALSGDRIATGVICPPVQASGRWWCPVGFTADGETITVSAVRVILLERYIADDYIVHAPAIAAELWTEEVAAETREAGDFGGLVVVTDPPSAKFVLLRERATFRGKGAPAQDAEETASASEGEAASDAAQGTTVVTNEARTESTPAAPVDRLVKISGEHFQKLLMLVERAMRFHGTATTTSVIESMIDARFETAGLELPQPKAEQQEDPRDGA